MTTQVSPIARERVQQLVANWDWPDPALLREIIALGEAAVPALAELLTPDVVRLSATEDRESALVYYVIHLLSETKSAAAIPILIDLYAALDRDDDLVESLPDAFLQIGPEAIGPLLNIAADESLNWFPRTSAMETVVHLAGTDTARRAQVAEALRPLLAERVRLAIPITPEQQQVRDGNRWNPINEDDSDIVAELVGSLADVNDLEARLLIEAAFRDGLVNTKLTDLDHINETYETGGETFFRMPSDWLGVYEKDWQKHQTEARLKALETENLTETIIVGRRLGRNDPCWCGSGKKYKKCHLAADEKAGRA